MPFRQKHLPMAIGTRIGLLVVTAILPKRNGFAWSECQCDCGSVCQRRDDHLRKGGMQSCGCLGSTVAHNAVRTHGQSGQTRTSEYNVWAGMKARCNNPNNPATDNYGGRGIKVCERWNDSFENFYADMGPRPSKDHSIERVDNELGYSPDNCIWATQPVQCNNTRQNHKLTHNGETLTLRQWERKLGLSRNTMYYRLKAGYSDAELFSTHKGRRSSLDRIRR